MRSLTIFCVLLFAAPVTAQEVGFGALERYGTACLKLEAAILTDQGRDPPHGRRRSVVRCILPNPKMYC